ncbi:MAG: OmpA family protein, partial [Pseudomonadota bacterium]
RLFRCETIARIADIAKGCPNVSISVDGHTDSTGSDTLNQRLSQQRAASVVSALVAAGVPADRLAAKGFGETRPLLPNNTAANRAKNRRIEFSVR